ncbi:hypothetical protein GHYDROH2_34310 [Geobacter hydrogenophilus]|uniref:Uncharacterized protein n=1 Tax=Geobacter hydrogenophilus TaxID=40983 RepID=A0A9W6LED4_9BACT|nr:hypothetical protein GHYDROH2_34310 [Geobacter hydrogenophilus]
MPDRSEMTAVSPRHDAAITIMAATRCPQAEWCANSPGMPESAIQDAATKRNNVGSRRNITPASRLPPISRQLRT